MNRNFANTNFSNSCYIYIVQDGNRKEYKIRYSLNLPEKNIVYLRMFDDFVDAMGHKLFLENISKNSLKRFINLHNRTIKQI
jgi:hypothetical protein